MRRPYVAIDRVLYVGQPVVAVLAETQAEAVDAAELVLVEYEQLPAVAQSGKGLARAIEQAGRE